MLIPARPASASTFRLSQGNSPVRSISAARSVNLSSNSRRHSRRNSCWSSVRANASDISPPSHAWRPDPPILVTLPRPDSMESMNSDKTRVALLGYGYWGPNLARNLHMRLGRDWVACVDPDPARRAEVAHRYPWVRGLADPAAVMADPGAEPLVAPSPPPPPAPLVPDAAD